MDQSVWGPGEYVALLSMALGGMYLLSRLAAWLGWVSTIPAEGEPEPAAVMSNPVPLGVQHDAHVHAHLTYLTRQWALERERNDARERERLENERDISANRRPAIKKMLDNERRYVPPDQWATKTEWKAAIGGNGQKTGQLYDELQRELDTVELEGLNAALATR